MTPLVRAARVSFRRWQVGASTHGELKSEETGGEGEVKEGVSEAKERKG